MNWQLSTPTDTLHLHPQFIWANEFDWQALAQSDPVYTLTGAMDIQQGIKKAGRPIILNGDDTRTTRADLAKLQTWADIPELEMTLTHPKGQRFGVIFNRPAITDITPITQYRPIDDSDDDKYTFNVHFLSV